MRDLIWTIIIVWVVWKLYDTFKAISKTKPQRANHYSQKEGEVKIDRNVDLKSHYNPDNAEYVDYEEVK